MKRLLYIFVILAALQSCSSSDDKIITLDEKPLGTSFFSKTCITAFIINPKFEFSGHNPKTGMIEIKTAVINTPDNYIMSGELFDELCAKYGDDSFNGRYDHIPITFVYADEFTSIDIVCDKDFDIKHPAGSSLADITMIMASSPYKFIKSKYKDYPNWNNLPYDYVPNYTGISEGFFPIYKLVSDMKPEDRTLLCHALRFTFTVTPPSGKLVYTITLKTKDKTFESKVTIG